MSLRGLMYKGLGGIAFGLVLMCAAFAVYSVSVSAEGASFSPNPTDVSTASPNGNRVSHIVSKADYNRVDRTQLVLYSPVNNISVAIVSADACDNGQKLDGVQDVRNKDRKSVV